VDIRNLEPELSTYFAKADQNIAREHKQVGCSFESIDFTRIALTRLCCHYSVYTSPFSTTLALVA
jgi:hypothetical protein